MCERLQKALEVRAQTEPCTAYSKTQAPFISVCKAGMFSMVTDTQLPLVVLNIRFLRLAKKICR